MSLGQKPKIMKTDNELRDKIHHILRTSDATNQSSWWQIADQVVDLIRGESPETIQLFDYIGQLEYLVANGEVEVSRGQFQFYSLLSNITRLRRKLSQTRRLERGYSLKL